MLFRDPGLQTTFEHDGFVVLDDFFPDHDLSHMRELLDGFEQQTEAVLTGESGTINSVEKGLYYTRHFADLGREEALRRELSQITTRALNHVLETEYKNVATLGILKRANSPDSTVDLHVHHSNLGPGGVLPGLSMFAPLHDLDDVLGPLALIKGSHALWKDDLSYTLTYMKQAYPDLYPLMQSCLTTVSPRAGQAIVFDQFTIHMGLPNTHATADRLAITAEFIPAGEQCVLFLPEFDAQGCVRALRGREVLKLPLEFSTEHRWVPRHLGEEVETIDPYEPLAISESDFRRCCRQ